MKEFVYNYLNKNYRVDFFGKVYSTLEGKEQKYTATLAWDVALCLCMTEEETIDYVEEWYAEKLSIREKIIFPLHGQTDLYLSE